MQQLSLFNLSQDLPIVPVKGIQPLNWWDGGQVVAMPCTACQRPLTCFVHHPWKNDAVWCGFCGAYQSVVVVEGGK